MLKGEIMATSLNNTNFQEQLSKKSTINILLVDDDIDDLFLITDLVKEGMHADINVDQASSFTEALEKIQANAYDLCLFDYFLGKDNGLELLEACRAEGIITPVIFLTGQSDDIVAVQMMKAGAADYVSKSNLTARGLCSSIKSTVRSQNEIEMILDYWNSRD